MQLRCTVPLLPNTPLSHTSTLHTHTPPLCPGSHCRARLSQPALAGCSCASPHPTAPLRPPDRMACALVARSCRHRLQGKVEASIGAGEHCVGNRSGVVVGWAVTSQVRLSCGSRTPGLRLTRHTHERAVHAQLCAQPLPASHQLLQHVRYCGRQLARGRRRNAAK